MELAGLDDAAARALLSTTAGNLGASDRELILRQAAGNPLALVELPGARRNATESSSDGMAYLPLSSRLERAFASRLTELPPQTRDALLIAAVDSEDELSEILAATAELTGQPVTAAVLDPAVEVGLLRFDARRVHFRHPLVRSGVLQSERAARRQEAHGALGASCSPTSPTAGPGTDPWPSPDPTTR